MAASKVIYGGQVLIDLTADTVTADKLASGYTAHGADGELITGVNTFDADTQDATATAAEILLTKIAYARGVKLTGTMPNNGTQSLRISDKNQSLQIAQGYHDGSGTAAIDDAEKAKLIPTNIRDGVTILGVLGTMSGSEDILAQSKTVTPTVTQQVVLPDEGYNYLTQVTVNAIPYVESENAAGGITVTIG